MADLVSLSISIAALLVGGVGSYFNWRQIRAQDTQFEAQLASQRKQFDEQLKTEASKIARLEGVVEQLQRQTRAQEEQVRLTEEQNRLLAGNAQVQREQLARDKRPFHKKVWDAIVGG